MKAPTEKTKEFEKVCNLLRNNCDEKTIIWECELVDNYYELSYILHLVNNKKSYHKDYTRYALLVKYLKARRMHIKANWNLERIMEKVVDERRKGMGKVIECNVFASGGGIDCMVGKLSDGNYFLGEYKPFPSVVIVNADCYNVDESFYVEWQEKHLVKYLSDDESVEFVKQIKEV